MATEKMQKSVVSVFMMRDAGKPSLLWRGAVSDDASRKWLGRLVWRFIVPPNVLNNQRRDEHHQQPKDEWCGQEGSNKEVPPRIATIKTRRQSLGCPHQYLRNEDANKTASGKKRSGNNTGSAPRNDRLEEVIGEAQARIERDADAHSHDLRLSHPVVRLATAPDMCSQPTGTNDDHRCSDGQCYAFCGFHSVIPTVCSAAFRQAPLYLPGNQWTVCISRSRQAVLFCLNRRTFAPSRSAAPSQSRR